MKSPQFTLYPICFFWTIGIVLSFYFTFPLAPILGFCFILVLVLFGTVQNKCSQYWGKLLTFCTLILCLAYSHGIQRQQLSVQHFLQHYSPNKTEVLELVLVERLRTAENQSRFYARVKSINGTACTGKLLFHLKTKTNPPLQLGEHLSVKAILKPLEAPKNPGAFDYKNYLETIEVYAALPFLSPENIKRIPAPAYSLFSLKARAIQKLEKSPLSFESKALILAMLFGERNAISREKIAAFGDAGILHILAISGLHIGLLLLVLQFIFSPFKRFGKYALLYHLLVLGSLWVYAFAVGASPSVIRAASMFSVFVIGGISKRKLPSFYWLLLSYFGLLLWNPLFLKQVGFQLSYFAVAGILILYPKLKSIWHPRNLILQKFWELSCISLSAQMAVAPLGLYYFGQFSGLFLLSNWIVLPFLSLYYILFILSSLGLIISGNLPQLLISAVDVGSQALFRYATWASDQKNTLWSSVVLDEVQLISSYTVLIFALLYLYKKRSHFLFLTIVVLFLGTGYSIEKDNKVINGETLWVLDQYKESSLAYRKGKQLHFYSTAKENRIVYALSGIKTLFPIQKVHYSPLKEAYLYKATSLLIINAPDAHQRPWPQKKDVVILLSHHPKIHLEMLLKQPNIVTVIADSSSPPYIKQKWAKTCKAYGIPFHDTSEKGAFEIIPENEG